MQESECNDNVAEQVVKQGEPRKWSEEHTNKLIKEAAEVQLPAKWEFFTERHARFTQFVGDNIPAGSALRAAFDTYAKVSPVTFLQMIGAIILHNDKDIPGYVTTLLHAYGEERAKYDVAVLQKVERYLSFFCDFIRNA